MKDFRFGKGRVQFDAKQPYKSTLKVFLKTLKKVFLGLETLLKSLA